MHLNISLIKLPDSVTFIDEKAFWRNESPWPVAIACEDTSMPIPIAVEKGYACQVMEPVLPENAFLDGYGQENDGHSYFAHVRRKEKIDYITIEFRDNEIEKDWKARWSIRSQTNFWYWFWTRT